MNNLKSKIDKMPMSPTEISEILKLLSDIVKNSIPESDLNPKIKSMLEELSIAFKLIPMLLLAVYEVVLRQCTASLINDPTVAEFQSDMTTLNKVQEQAKKLGARF